MNTTRLAPLTLALCAAPALAVPQVLPSAWDRAEEWVAPPPVAAGTTQGNPAPDSAGNLVWHYDSTFGGGALGSASPWYAEPLTPLVWDTAWYGGVGAWAVSNDFGTVVYWNGSTHLLQQVSTGWFDYAPVIRWRSPAAQPLRVGIVGSLRVIWSGPNGATRPVDVDVVIVHRSATTGVVTLLDSRTVAKPTQNNVSEFLEFPIDLPGVLVQPGDDLFVTHRGRTPTSSSFWVTLYDRLEFVRLSIGGGFCGPAVVNSTGGPGRMGADGSTHVADNQLTLRAYQLPLSTFAFFLASRSQGFVAHPAGSSGNLCLAGAIGRFVGPGQIFDVGLGRVASLHVDLTQIPTPTGIVAVQPGETWNFQCWHRDIGGTSNFSDGLSIAFD